MPLPFAPFAPSRDHLPRVIARDGDEPYVKPPHRAEHGMRSSYERWSHQALRSSGQIMIPLKSEGHNQQKIEEYYKNLDQVTGCIRIHTVELM